MGRARRQAVSTTVSKFGRNQAGSERAFPGRRDGKSHQVANEFGRSFPTTDSIDTEDNSEVSRKQLRAQQTYQKEQSRLCQVGHILDILQADITSRNRYINLALQLCLFAFYLFVIGIQFRQLDAYEMVSSITNSVVPPQQSVPTTVYFLTWLKTQVFYIWTEPICGDGVCQSPTEVPSFGRFGCKADCGPESDVLPMLVYIEVGDVQHTFKKLAKMALTPSKAIEKSER
ncbi:hypothetical protein CYMTET_23968 [Cymbomonas tetramitiformis]|uniref:Uncharacterized protein n=1 Tax=Cymbomonas tetramitiformis TaxID=36881 RepID=A0AAE0FXM9_9CHLO|nr:hypothetical protein CYMTET_23968 [Cymbomonas tetramitiformis]